MTRDIKYGLLFVALCAAIYAVAFVFVYLGRAFEFKTYPQYVLPAAALAPLFFSNMLVRKLADAKPAKLTTKEHVVFAVISILGVAVMAAVTEADFLYRALVQDMDITYGDVLFAPLSARYTVTVLFGASFMLSAAAVAGYISAIRIPATLSLRMHRTATPDAQPCAITS